MPLRERRISPGAMNDAEQRWADAGRPDCTRYGVTVTPEGTRVWLDSPDNLVH